MSMGNSYQFKKELGVGIFILLILTTLIPSINAGDIETQSSYKLTGISSDNKQSIISERAALVSNCISAASKIKESEKNFKSTKNQEEFYEINEKQHSHQPLLGGNEIFGLWVRIIYNDNEILEKIDINPRTIRGKLSDPGYRTPIKFNVDDDAEEDIETGFGFFRYGIDEITDMGVIDHSAWATAFDFMQINNGLDDQLGEIEVWQEFHVNLKLIKNKAVGKPVKSSYNSVLGTSLLNKNGKLQNIFMNLFLRSFVLAGKNLRERIDILGDNPIFSHLANLLNQYLSKSQNDKILNMIKENDIESLAASEDYFVTRVGFRSIEGQKIPFRFEKKFAIAKDNIFRPIIFQHEMDPNDIISSATYDVMFDFQSYQEGHNNPAYDIEFDINFNPAVYTITQFTPRSGKVFYYHHSVGPTDSLDITFSSNIIKGSSSDEEKEGSLSLTLTIDSPGEVAGSGKWMCFDPKIIGDGDLLGGKFIYTASHKFDVGITLNSPRFEEKVEFKGIPKNAELEWDVDVDLDVGSMVKLDVEGFIQLNMDSQLDEVIVYYPKLEPTDPDISFIEVHGIPNYEKTGALATLYVDPNNILNPNNYVYGKAYRDFSTNLDSIQAYLPNISIPIVEITDIPSYSAVAAKLLWNKLQGYARTERYSDGAPDPVNFNLVFDTFTVNNELEISDGYAQGDFKIAKNGYLGFDTSKEMFSDTLEISDSAEDNSLSISVDEVSANDLQVSWGLDNSGDQIKIQSLGINGFLKTLNNFQISMSLEGKNGNFNGDWSLAESGSFEIDFYQDENIQLDFDIGDEYEDFDLNGYIELKNDLHFDMSWKWKQGSYGDPACFKINENTNEANLQEMNLYFTYKDKWGANVTLYNAGIYICVEWYWQNYILYIWPVINVYGNVDLHLLLNGNWYYNVEDNWP